MGSFLGFSIDVAMRVSEAENSAGRTYHVESPQDPSYKQSCSEALFVGSILIILNFFQCYFKGRTFGASKAVWSVWGKGCGENLT